VSVGRPTTTVRRLILFDIDGTLVRGGPAKDAFQVALVETFGTAGDTTGVSFAGKTDPQIARELMHGAGLLRADIDRGMVELWPRYLRHLEERLEDRPVEVIPGVVELLDALAPLEDVGIGLVTGNIEGGARLKLRSARLWDRFRFGGYGSDHEERDPLPAIALRRARDVWGHEVEPRDAVVIGDTPRDVACGRIGGARTLAVATGGYDARTLEATGADHVLPDLCATEAVLSWLLS